jgi:hypothetical protein
MRARTYGDMITLLDLIRIILTISGFLVGAILASEFGIVGTIFGALGGGTLAFLIGVLFDRIGLWRERRRLARFTSEELRAQLHEINCWTPNLLLWEHQHRRTRGFAALLSGFPEFARFLRSYNPMHSQEACEQKMVEFKKRYQETGPPFLSERKQKGDA